MQIPYEVTARRDTGLYNAKLGIWLFLASEVMLFGGLFSAYVFLRVGTQAGFDNPWPMGANVQKIVPGFINTLVLIASSVFVVFAWVSLKERKYRNYQLWMVGVILCAAIFMGLKAYEYSDKLLRHHDIKLVDNSIIGGSILDHTDKIRFAAEKVTVDLTGGLPGFMGEIDGDEDIEFTVEGGKEGAKTVKLSGVKKWFMEGRRRTLAEISEKRDQYHHEIKAGKKDAAMPNVNTKAVLIGKFNLHASPQKLVGVSADGLNYRDRTSIGGKLVDDKIRIEVHNVNLQMIPYAAQGTVLAWKYLGDDVKTRVLHERDQKAEKLGGNLSRSVLQGPYLNYHNLHGDDHHAASGAHGTGEKKAHGGDHGSDDEAHKALIVEIPRDQARFVSNHGPRAGTYYAIYFTMTGLHGLHVVGGALVLTFFLVFGKGLYQRNPEHLANRIEVGGLFWHFVDLVWIFLFPIMYLM